MRTWRVGTVSMGAALMLLGVLLLSSRIGGYEVYTIMTSWWSVILIVLGIEIIIFLFINRKENNTSLKYDVFSILFIGFIGMIGIGFTLVSSLGIVDEIQGLMSSQEETRDLPPVELQLPNSVERIVIETDYNPLVIEGTDSSEFSIFGTYRAQFSANDQQLIETENDYVSTQQKGDTLYVTLKRLPERNGFNYHYSTMSVTMLVPSNRDVEVRRANEVVLRPRVINADFLIEQVSNVTVHLPTNSDVLLQATNVQQLSGTNLEWDVIAPDNEGYDEEAVSQRAQIQLGDGQNKMSFLNADHVSVYK